eukprot:CAMPEP_0175889530 /NCGR_PEP_ID=MMETSP0107_2-20121207/47323_1 /TAXON_ID=195067 ORGANISM="Goniomonas pacifica, Strain CCMP1869" /NCGR_SAMPLE_ID=MMETSP0107_2 /ASSEMBLY_ACC=CAM_ASM_000203 /LENGTH=117 /DNA_ID=CAMNT_0017210193 /DNA_START=63 /DNA_END=417 /DNA_ORIENTATION=-
MDLKRYILARFEAGVAGHDMCLADVRVMCKQLATLSVHNPTESSVITPAHHTTLTPLHTAKWVDMHSHGRVRLLNGWGGVGVVGWNGWEEEDTAVVWIGHDDALLHLHDGHGLTELP